MRIFEPLIKLKHIHSYFGAVGRESTKYICVEYIYKYTYTYQNTRFVLLAITLTFLDKYGIKDYSDYRRRRAQPINIYNRRSLMHTKDFTNL